VIEAAIGADPRGRNWVGEKKCVCGIKAKSLG